MALARRMSPACECAVRKLGGACQSSPVKTLSSYPGEDADRATVDGSARALDNGIVREGMARTSDIARQDVVVKESQRQGAVCSAPVP